MSQENNHDNFFAANKSADISKNHGQGNINNNNIISREKEREREKETNSKAGWDESGLDCYIKYILVYWYVCYVSTCRLYMEYTMMMILIGLPMFYRMCVLYYVLFC